MSLQQLFETIEKGGPNSGNHGHGGIPGHLGGSISGSFPTNTANNQNMRERMLDELGRGVISADEGNIQMVRNERFRVITHIPSSVRKALNQGVKDGKLGHLKKEGAKPEVYYHPNFKDLAVEARNQAVDRRIRALSGVLSHADINEIK